ncbi:MAG: hypothetical protein HY238_03765, partial [Acidobacteria bacterium]|nr:hypothetical protein [Acidobacteriota bacterium]
MTSSRREFLAGAAAAGTRPALAAVSEPLDGFRIARRHAIVRDLPTPNFFEGMLLGNGDIGVCVTVRPDALGLHIGKEDSWDTRVSEDHYQHVLHFQDFLKLWERASEEAKRRGQPDLLYLERNIDFFAEYTDKVTSSYRKPWPRPWPCGIVWIHWDSRMTRLVRQTLDPSNGLLTIELEHEEQRRLQVFCFVNRTANHVCVATDQAAPFVSVAYYPYTDPEAQLPPPKLAAAAGRFACQDGSFALAARLRGAWNAERTAQRVLLRSREPQPFRLDLTLFTPRDHQDNAGHAEREAARLAGVSFAELQRDSEREWTQFWARSAVEFEDKELERIWYHNQYFLACCLREGKVAPGLFGNWTSGKIGTAWHGDYHLNYNTQQVYWGVFSSNHVEQ